MIDSSSGHIAVDGELFAGHAIKRKARTDLGHASRAFGDDDEIHDEKHAEDNQSQIDRAAHDKHRKALDHFACGGGSGMAFTDDQFGG